jgi:hypothetical protein
MSNVRFKIGYALIGFNKLIHQAMIRNAFLLLKFFTALLVISWASFATADSLNGEKSFCEKKALIKTQPSNQLQLDPEYDSAMLSVAKLPEFIQVKNDISSIDKRNSMQFDSGRDEQYKTTDGKCYWQVTVYMNREDESRMVLWHTFLVDKDGKVESVNNLEDDYISLPQWRNSNLFGSAPIFHSAKNVIPIIKVWTLNL